MDDVANGISWGGLAPEMFGIHGVYHMVPICLAIGVFCPLPFIAAVSYSCVRVVHRAQGD